MPRQPNEPEDNIPQENRDDSNRASNPVEQLLIVLESIHGTSNAKIRNEMIRDLSKQTGIPEDEILGHIKFREFDDEA